MNPEYLDDKSNSKPVSLQASFDFMGMIMPLEGELIGLGLHIDRDGSGNYIRKLYCNDRSCEFERGRISISDDDAENLLDELWSIVPLDTIDSEIAYDAGNWELIMLMSDGGMASDCGSCIYNHYKSVIDVLKRYLPSMFDSRYPSENNLNEDVPFFHITDGWIYKGSRITEEDAGRLCSEMGIPFEPTCEESPDRHVFLTEVHVAGTDYVRDFGKLTSELRLDDILDLEREQNNEFDTYAVKVIDGRGRKLGYLPRKMNHMPARMMDSGMHLYCRVSSISSNDMSVAVFMDAPGKKVRRHFSRIDDPLVTGFVIDSRPATSSNTDIGEVPDQVRHIVLKREFSDDDIWNLRWGHRSLTMEDRWNMVYEDGIIHIARSWTGTRIFTITLGEGDTHDVLVNSNPKQYRSGTDEEVLELLKSLLDSWLDPVYISVDIMPGSITGNVEMYYYRDDGKPFWTVNDYGELEWTCSHWNFQTSE